VLQINYLQGISQASDFMYIRPVEAELCHANRRADGQTERQTVMKLSRRSKVCESAQTHTYILSLLHRASS
jgi:hypothetical protein